MSPLSLVVTSSTPTADDRLERFRSIYDATFDDLVRYCRRRLSEVDAGDAVSEIYLTAWRRLDDLPEADSARLWLFGVARNVLANLHRSRDRRERLDLRLAAQPPRPATPGPEHAVVDETGVIAALATLRPDDAELLRLIAWEGLSHAEAGVVLGCTANAVAIRLHRAKARLAEAMATGAERAAPPHPSPEPRNEPS